LRLIFWVFSADSICLTPSSTFTAVCTGAGVRE
jgi:hypothetical protein